MAERGNGTSPRSLLAYYGHHKCASSWIADVMSPIIDEIGLRYVGAYDLLAPAEIGPITIEWNPTRPFDRAVLRQELDAREADFVTVGSADRDLAAILKPERAFHVIRDPRDLVVSGYFSHRNSHPTAGWPHLQAHREALLAVPQDEGLLLEMEFADTAITQIGDWDYADETVLELRMEDLVRHPYDSFLRVFAHLGLLVDDEPARARQQVVGWGRRLANRLARRKHLAPLRRAMPATGELVLGTVYAKRFEKKAGGRSRGVEDATSHYRKGVAGDWRNHFTLGHAERFEARYGGLLTSLGYEDSDDWVERAYPRTAH